jgi:PAS domain S-box-containing protein
MSLDRFEKVIGKESETFKMMHFLVENTADIIVIIDSDGKIAYSNPQASYELEYPAEEFEKIKLQQLNTDLTDILKNNKVTPAFKSDLCTKSGKNKRVEIKVQHFQPYMLLLIKKIPASDSAFPKIREKPLKYQLLAEYSTDLITRHSPDGTCTYASPSCERILGYSPQEIVGRTNFEFILEEDIPIAQQVYPEILSKPIVQTSTYRVKHKLGHTIWFESTCQAIKDPRNGEITEIYATSRDISERKKFEKELIEAKEKAVESDYLKTAFLQNMSHEIRTPINAIMGFSDLLVEHLDDKEKLRYFSEIISSRSNDLLEIINDILDIARIEAGQAKVNNETFQLKNLMDDLINFFSGHQVKLKKQHIDFALKLSKETENLSITTDRVKLKQILINLIGNAFKFTHQGKIEGGTYISDNQLTFYVSDTGIGIPEDKHGYIFERFSQISSYEKNLGGTGLGLTIVKGLVKLLGGEVSLKSIPHQGTTFYFTINCKIQKGI